MDIVRNQLKEKGNDVDESWHIRCVFHILNRAVKDSEPLFVSQVANIGELIKKIRVNPALRECCNPLQLALGSIQDKVCDVPELDVDARWNSMYLMVKSALNLRSVFNSMCDHPEHGSISS